MRNIMGIRGLFVPRKRFKCNGMYLEGIWFRINVLDVTKAKGCTPMEHSRPLIKTDINRASRLLFYFFPDFVTF